MEKWDIIKYHLRQKKSSSADSYNNNVNLQPPQPEIRPRKVTDNMKVKNSHKGKVTKETKFGNTLCETSSSSKENTKPKQGKQNEKLFQNIKSLKEELQEAKDVIKKQQCELNEINKILECSKISNEREVEYLNIVINEKNKLVIDLKMELQKLEIEKNEHIKLLEWTIQDLKDKIEKIKLDKWVSVAVDSLDEHRILRDCVMENPNLLQITVCSNNNFLSELDDFSQDMELTEEITNAPVETTVPASETEGLDVDFSDFTDFIATNDNHSAQQETDKLEQRKECVSSNNINEDSDQGIDFSDFFEFNESVQQAFQVTEGNNKLKEKRESISSGNINNDSVDEGIDFSDLFENVLNDTRDETLLKDLNVSPNGNAYEDTNIKSNHVVWPTSTEGSVDTCVYTPFRGTSNKITNNNTASNYFGNFNNHKRNDNITGTETDFSEISQDSYISTSSSSEIQASCTQFDTTDAFNRNKISIIQDSEKSFKHFKNTSRKEIRRKYLRRRNPSRNCRLSVEQTFSNCTDETDSELEVKRKSFILFKKQNNRNVLLSKK